MVMTALTGACPSPWAVARSRSASATRPARASPRVMPTPPRPSRRQSRAASSTWVVSATTRGPGSSASRATRVGATAAGTAAATAAATSASELSLTTAEAAAVWPPPPTARRAAATSSRAPRLRAVTNTRPSISTRRKYASAPVRSITRCATTLTPSTYSSSCRADNSTVASGIGSSTAVASAPASVTLWAGVRALVSHFSSSSVSAPQRMHHASASASRVVVVANVSDPVSSWMPRAKTVASKGVTGMPRSAMIRTSSVTSDPSLELTSASGSR